MATPCNHSPVKRGDFRAAARLKPIDDYGVDRPWELPKFGFDPQLNHIGPLSALDDRDLQFGRFCPLEQLMQMVGSLYQPPGLVEMRDDYVGHGTSMRGDGGVF